MLVSEAKIKDKSTDSNNLFPVFLKLSELNTLIVGGGSVGLEKLTALLNNSPKAKVTLVAPSIKDNIQSFVRQYSNVKLIKRVFLPEDLENKDIVIAATNDKELNRVIKDEAKAKRILTNIADTPDSCDFYLSSIVQKGSIKLAISTNGKSPTIAKRLKEVLNNAIPDEMENVLNNLVQIRSRLNGNFSEKVKELNNITSVLVNEPKKKSKLKLYLVYAAVAIILMVLGHLIFQNISFTFLGNFIEQLYSSSDLNFHWFVFAGFAAQMIDGTLGMGYGISAATFLLSVGIPPVAVSASVHSSELFTSCASGLSHLKFGNINKKLFKQLIIPGILGALTGAFVLSLLSKYSYLVKPVVAGYTLTVGIVIIRKVFKNEKGKDEVKHITPIAGAGGFLDAVGGGGWGTIVTSSLIAKGSHPIKVIGSVILARFFVALTSTIVFIIFIGLTHWYVILGLIAGGIIAAPVAAKASGRIPLKTIMLLVGGLVIFLSLRNIYTVIF
jgi:siroheme synthase-like protein